MNINKKLKIGAITYDVEFVEEMESDNPDRTVMGRHSYVNATIKDGQPTRG